MRRMIVIGTAVVLVLLAVLTMNVAAQMPDTRDKTFMTFSGAVELPGLRLEPGTYVFKLADSPTRNVIQVFTQDEKDILGQWLFVPTERQEVSGETVVTFKETSAGSTPAVQYWFYPGESTGKEFIYPKDQAMRIASRTGTAVLTEQGRVGGQASAVGTSGTSSDAQLAPAQEQGAVAVEQHGVGVVNGSGLPDSQQADAPYGPDSAKPESTIASADVQGSNQSVRDDGYAQADRPAQNPSTMRTNDTDNRTSELPQTASPLGLTALMSLLSLAGAGGIRMFRQ